MLCVWLPLLRVVLGTGPTPTSPASAPPASFITLFSSLSRLRLPGTMESFERGRWRGYGPWLWSRSPAAPSLSLPYSKKGNSVHRCRVESLPGWARHRSCAFTHTHTRTLRNTLKVTKTSYLLCASAQHVLNLSQQSRSSKNVPAASGH